MDIGDMPVGTVLVMRACKLCAKASLGSRPSGRPWRCGVSRLTGGQSGRGDRTRSTAGRARFPHPEAALPLSQLTYGCSPSAVTRLRTFAQARPPECAIDKLEQKENNSPSE